VKRLRVSYNQNDETLSRNSLRYLSKANLTIAVNCSCRAPLKVLCALWPLYDIAITDIVWCMALTGGFGGGGGGILRNGGAIVLQ